MAPRYYASQGSEIDFVLQNGTEIIPVEAKGGEGKSAPSFKKYIADRQPEYALRYSKRDYRKDGAITNLPLYLARKTKELLLYNAPSHRMWGSGFFSPFLRELLDILHLVC